MVRMSDTAYGIESFEVVDDGGADRLIRLNGWFYSRSGVAGMQLALPNHALAIEQFTLPSEGLLELFGEAGRNCRFRLEARAPADIAFEQGRLLAVIANNDGVMVDISEMLTYGRAGSVPLTDQVAPIPEPPQAAAPPSAEPAAPPSAEPAATTPEPAATSPEPASAHPETGAFPPEIEAPAPHAGHDAQPGAASVPPPEPSPPESSLPEPPRPEPPLPEPAAPAPVFAPRDPIPDERRKQFDHAVRNVETESWRFLTGDAEPDPEPPPPVSEIPPEPDDRPTLLGRLLGRKSQDNR